MGAQRTIEQQAAAFMKSFREYGPMVNEMHARSAASDVRDADKKNDNGDSQYRSEFRAEPMYAKSMSEADYVAMRRVDDGLDCLGVFG